MIKTTINPVINKTYPVPFALRDAVAKCIDEMLEAGIIERSVSPYCNPLRIVKKSDGKVRVCLDGRELNKYLEDDHESPPIIEELMQQFFNCKYFSKIDLTQGYFQIELHKESRPYTAFRFGPTLYQFVRVPFGVKTAGSAFIRALGMAFEKGITNFNYEVKLDDSKKECRNEGMQVLLNNLQTRMSNYIDDIVIGTETFEGHIRMLQIIFEIIIENNLTLNFKKCEFFRIKISFLGFELSNLGIKPDPDCVWIITEFEEPKNQTDLQQILDICNYYRRFILMYSNYIHSFRDLLQKDAIWLWSEQHSQAYRQLKENFKKAVCLNHIISGAQFKVQCDASITGLGGVLYEIDNKNNYRIISVAARCLTCVESKYMTYY